MTMNNNKTSSKNFNKRTTYFTFTSFCFFFLACPSRLYRLYFYAFSYYEIMTCFILFKEGFAQPDQENGAGDFDDLNGLTVGNVSGVVAGNDETY